MKNNLKTKPDSYKIVRKHDTLYLNRNTTSTY